MNAHPKAEYPKIKKKIIAEYRKKPRDYGFFCWKYEVSKYFVGQALQSAGLNPGKTFTKPETSNVPLSYLSCLLDEWERPKGMGRYLEEKNAS